MSETFVSSQDSYTVLSEHAHGGMGVTYLVQSVKSGEKLILKQLRMDRVEDWKMVELFEREADVLRSLDHPNIPNYVDYFATEGQKTFALVQEFIDGRTLQSMIDERATVSTEKFIDYLSQCLEVLDYLHKRVPPVVHRDISPKNIIIRDDTAFVVDFGAVKQAINPMSSGMSTMVGTFGYMAPEQMMGRAQAGSDVYSLGMSFVAFASHTDPAAMPIDEQTGQINVRAMLNLPDQIEIVLESMTRINMTERIKEAGVASKRLRAIPSAVEGRASLTSPYVSVGYQSISEVTPIRLGTVSIQNEATFLDYVKSDPKWHENLIADREGYTALLRWISQVQDLSAKKSFDEMVSHHRKEGERNVREAVIRYFEPEAAVTGAGLSLNLFQTQDLIADVRAFFKSLDGVFRNTDFLEVKFILFQLEWALWRLKKVTGPEIGAQVDEIVEHIASAFQQKEPKSGSLPILYRQMTTENLIRLFHRLDPERGFRDDAFNRLESLEEVAFWIAKNPDLFTANYLQPERCAFLDRIERADLTKMDRVGFLFEVFAEKVRSGIRINKLSYDKKSRTWEIKFKVGHSLGDFFAEHGVDPNAASVAGHSDSMKLSGGLMSGTGGLRKKFLNGVDRKYGVDEAGLGEHGLEGLKSNFARRVASVKKRFVRAMVSEYGAFSGRCFLYLLPALTMFLYYLVFYAQSLPVMNVLDVLWPFELTFSREFVYPTDGDLSTGFFIILFSFCSTLPGIVAGVVFGPKKLNNAKKALNAWLGSFVFLIPLFIFINFWLNIALMFIAMVLMITGERPFWKSGFLVALLLIAGIGLGIYASAGERGTPESYGVTETTRKLTPAYQTGRYSVTIRSGPDEDAIVVREASRTDTMWLIEDSGDGWYHVVHDDFEGYVTHEEVSFVPIILGFIAYRTVYLMNAMSYDSTHDATAPSGRPVGILDVYDDWYKIRYKQKEGYVKKKDVWVEEWDAGKKTARVKNWRTNLYRESRGTNYLRQLYRGEEVTALAHNHNRFKVRIGEDEGWVIQSHLVFGEE